MLRAVDLTTMASAAMTEWIVTASRIRQQRRVCEVVYDSCYQTTTMTKMTATMVRVAIDDDGDGTTLGTPGDQCEPARK